MDVTSQTTLEQAAQACQQALVTIFAFAALTSLNEIPTGQRSLRKLTEMTGGNLLEHDGTDAEIGRSVEAMAAKMRSGYLLSYRPLLTWITSTLIPALAAHSITVSAPPANALTSTFEAS